MNWKCTSLRWNNKPGDEYTALEWRCMKVLYALLFFVFTIYALNQYNSIPYPVGILRLIDGSILMNPVARIAVCVSLAVLLVLYVLEVGMMVCTFLLFTIGVFVYSIGESNGVWGRIGILSLVFFAQFAAYALNYLGLSQKLNRNRVQFAIQIIAAVYTLAAISKIATSGIDWFINSPNISLQVLKSFNYQYVTNGNLQLQQQGTAMAEWIMTHPLLTKFLLCGSLVLEVFAFVLLINKTWAFVFGLLLLAMHKGMSIVMNIFFPSISLPMVIFCINPLYLVVVLFLFLKNKYLPLLSGVTGDTTGN